MNANQYQLEYLKKNGIKTKKELKKNVSKYLKIYYDKRISDDEIAWCRLEIDGLMMNDKHNISFAKRSLTKVEGGFGRQRLKNKYPKAKVIKIHKIKTIGYIQKI